MTTPDAFDPYHRWLGIPSADQPPSHYRLLAINVFESDPEVIRDAAEQRMAHVRTYQLGPNSAMSQKILNELAAAKACLLDPAMRAAYDEQLRDELAAANPAPLRTITPALSPKRSWQAIAVIGVGTALVCLVGVLLLSGRGKNGKEMAEAQVEQQPTMEKAPSRLPIASTSKVDAGSEPTYSSTGPATPPAQPSEHSSIADNGRTPSAREPDVVPPTTAPKEESSEAMPQATASNEPSNNSQSVDASSAARPVAESPIVVPGEKQPDDHSLFVGQWECGNDVITLEGDFTARKPRQNPLGKWECVNGEARIAWNDGLRTVLRRDGEGFQKLTWKAGASPDSPPWPAFTTPAVKKSDHEAEPTPSPSSRSTITQHEFIPLFNGRNLKGWHLRTHGPLCWSVKKGELVCIAREKGLDLITDKTFHDFELHLDFMLGREANSGVYLRGLYEVQLADTHSVNKKGCGAICNKIAPSEEAYLGPERWNTLSVKIVGQRVTINLNGTCVIGDAYISGPTDKKYTLPLKEGEAGPIILQCWENEFRFRNIRIRPLE